VTTATHYPSSPEGKQFCQFFSHRFNFIEAPASHDKKPDWKTITAYPIEHRNLWHRWQDPDTLIGVSFGKETRYALLDIDRNSPYHPANNEKAYREILGAYEDVGLVGYVPILSSQSGGIHLYFPFPKALPTYKIACLMRLTATRSGYTIKDGILETFPNTKTYNKKYPSQYKAHRLPLQKNSYLLDNDLHPYSQNIATFLERSEKAAREQDIDLIETAIEIAYQSRKQYWTCKNSSTAQQFKSDLEEQFSEGWSDLGQTNDLLRVIGTYARIFLALEGSDLAEYIAQTAQTLPNYHKYCQHQHHIHKRAEDWARCVEKFYYPYGSQATRTGSYARMGAASNRGDLILNPTNQERSQQAKNRLQQSIDSLKQIGNYAQKASQRLKQILQQTKEQFGIGISPGTLWKETYKPLWHPDYDDILPNQDLNQNHTADFNSTSSLPIAKKTLVLQSKPHSQKEQISVHTPLSILQKAAKQPNSALDKELSLLDRTPPYMKVFVDSSLQNPEKKEIIQQEGGAALTFDLKPLVAGVDLVSEIENVKERAEIAKLAISQPKSSLSDAKAQINALICKYGISTSSEGALSAAATDTGTPPLHPRWRRVVLDTIGRWFCQVCTSVRDRLYRLRQQRIQASIPLPQTPTLKLKEFLVWYSRVPKSETGILDVPHQYLPTNVYGEPYVKIGEPDRWLKLPYTLMLWDKAAKIYPTEEIGFDIPVVYAGEESSFSGSTEEIQSQCLKKGTKAIVLPEPHSDLAMVYIRVADEPEGKAAAIAVPISLLEEIVGGIIKK
jgi:hypothetical protein